MWSSQVRTQAFGPTGIGVTVIVTVELTHNHGHNYSCIRYVTVMVTFETPMIPNLHCEKCNGNLNTFCGIELKYPMS